MVSKSQVIGIVIVLIFISTTYYLDATQITSSTYSKPSFLAKSIPPPTNSTCYSCHYSLSDLLDNKISRPATEWEQSAHYSSEVVIMCSECHGGNSSTLIISEAKSNASGYIEIENLKDIIDICGKCHETQYEQFQQSIHWNPKDNNSKLVCFDCHSDHNIKTYKDPSSATNKQNEPKTCGKCHEKEYNGYYQTFHGKYLNLGNNYVASCSDCHHTHNVLPQSDPNSTTHPSKLSNTCASCHDNEQNKKIAEGYYHYVPDDHKPNLIFDKDELSEKESHYYIGPFDIAFYIPFLYGILIVLFVFTLTSFIFIETIISKRFRRNNNEK